MHGYLRREDGGLKEVSLCCKDSHPVFNLGLDPPEGTVQSHCFTNIPGAYSEESEGMHKGANDAAYPGSAPRALLRAGGDEPPG